MTALSLENRLEVLLMIAHEVFCNSDRGYLCCFKQELTSVLQLASKWLRAGNRRDDRVSVKILSFPPSKILKALESLDRLLKFR